MHLVLLPTYNERENILELLDAILCIPEVHVLVIDDTSPDGTYKVVENRQKKYDDLHLYLNKKKEGIGAAYVKGFRYAMEKLHADVIIEFDGDSNGDLCRTYRRSRSYFRMERIFCRLCPCRNSCDVSDSAFRP